jgi:hypothetical protein
MEFSPGRNIERHDENKIKLPAVLSKTKICGGFRKAGTHHRVAWGQTNDLLLMPNELLAAIGVRRDQEDTPAGIRPR